MMKSGIADVNMASYDVDRFEATSLDHTVDDILILLSNPISDK